MTQPALFRKPGGARNMLVKRRNKRLGRQGINIANCVYWVRK